MEARPNEKGDETRTAVEEMPVAPSVVPTSSVERPRERLSEGELRMVEQNLLTLAESSPAVVGILQAAGFPQRALRGLPEPPPAPREPPSLASTALAQIRQQEKSSVVLKSVSAPNIAAAANVSSASTGSNLTLQPASSMPGPTRPICGTAEAGASAGLPDPLEAAHAGYEAARRHHKEILNGRDENELPPFARRDANICGPM